MPPIEPDKPTINYQVGGLMFVVEVHNTEEPNGKRLTISEWRYVFGDETNIACTNCQNGFINFFPTGNCQLTIDDAKIRQEALATELKSQGYVVDY